MKHVVPIILKEWKIQLYIQPWQPLAPIAEHSIHCHLLLERDVLALHYGEAKARYNTWLQAFSKLYLSEACLLEGTTMRYEVLYIAKGGVTFDIPLCDSSTSLMTLQLTHNYLHSTIDPWSLNLQHVYNTFFTCTHVKQEWALVSHERNH